MLVHRLDLSFNLILRIGARIKPRTSHTPGECSNTEVYPHPFIDSDTQHTKSLPSTQPQFQIPNAEN